MVAEQSIPLIPLARFELNQRRAHSPHAALWDLLDAVKDPEIPVLSIWDLGVLQDIQVEGCGANAEITVTITPTYSGCPALSAMAEDITAELQAHGYAQVRVITRLSPAWTTDWLSSESRERLNNYGVAPPESKACPQCGSENTVLISEFGSTACKALYRCADCAEPFDRFKSL